MENCTMDKYYFVIIDEQYSQMTVNEFKQSYIG